MNKTLALATVVTSAILLLSVRSIAAQKNATSSTRSSPARVVRNIGEVRTVYVQRLNGDREFSRRLMNEMRAMKIVFVNSSRQADALFDARGDYENGAFWGSIKFTNQRGNIIWSASATRPRGSNYMAYSRLADKLRSALKR